ncbi:coenzyme F420-0:L-glutamate ligase [Candidatus Woesearchaeota archaeon]|nr:coenzyme F420-0:L-glutamate ligase [Candidatus Woesearchaeota archaeon]
MEIIPIKTSIFHPPKDDLFSVLDRFLTDITEKDIILISSKVVAIHQGRCIPKSKISSKDELIQKEADLFIPREECPGEYVVLTVKENTLIPSAGIDESNADNHYILWPEQPSEAAHEIWTYLRNKHKVSEIAVILTDSVTPPLRSGVVGISVGFFGMYPQKDYRQTTDLFERKMQMSQSNLVDGLAAAAVLVMGEGDECTPIALIRNAEMIKFTDQATQDLLPIAVEQDIYYPLLRRFLK